MKKENRNRWKKGSKKNESIQWSVRNKEWIWVWQVRERKSEKVKTVYMYKKERMSIWTSEWKKEWVYIDIWKVMKSKR